jgi:hypothetical protein
MRHVTQFIPFAVDSKTWCVEAIPAAVARPAQCPCCGIASRAPGRGLMLHGHGRRQRHQRGPEVPEQRPDTRVVLLRRYRCLGCRAVMCVGPCDVAPRYLYSGAAIVWAMALWGLAGLSTSALRRRVSIWRRVGASAQGRWQTLLRWPRDSADGRLFAGIPLHHADGLRPRQLAERLAMAIAARAPPSLRGMRMTDCIFWTPHTIWLGAPF